MVNEVSNVVVLKNGIGANIQTSKLWCSVALQAAGGSGTNAKLLINTGSAVSIIPHCFYKDYFKDIALNNVRLITYTKESIPVLGRLTLDVMCNSKSAKCPFYVVPVGTPILSMNPITALQLDMISQFCAALSTNAADYYTY